MGIYEDLFTAAFWSEAPPRLPEWVEWKHISQGTSHCPVCLTLDRCWFPEDNKPELPQHPHCHCTVLPIPLQKVIDEATAVCNIRKFSDYIFNPEYDYNGKRALFESWGFSILDAEMLQKEFERLALDKYIAGQYKLGKLDDKGQRISIVIELKRKDNEETVTVKSGWMIDPEGEIRLTTPLGGK